ncbi:uncharacterized protein THITE_2119621 [Thermothielavioides terrestris NRRL 8126]|uniref:Uncharacterized protein n=1 Tax=Thermothielavioides terrestris (strain ATCC 38088 / NRRL 8126) TaxID=578455 RepID=G2RC13_THETT|nr:uncharacterized protein THITE_2119621 [Thermothielavioides terrestris NRRL 8126]AEO69334.1 hypothetical protein THITE_2119621 [Thermothielavioides terrestris NRRL 8126]
MEPKGENADKERKPNSRCREKERDEQGEGELAQQQVRTDVQCSRPGVGGEENQLLV